MTEEPFSDQLEQWLASDEPKTLGRLGEVFAEKGFAVLILMTDQGRAIFDAMGIFFQGVLQSVDEGSRFMFDIHPRPEDELVDQQVVTYEDRVLHRACRHRDRLNYEGHSEQRHDERDHERFKIVR